MSTPGPGSVLTRRRPRLNARRTPTTAIRRRVRPHRQRRPPRRPGGIRRRPTEQPWCVPTDTSPGGAPPRPPTPSRPCTTPWRRRYPCAAPDGLHGALTEKFPRFVADRFGRPQSPRDTGAVAAHSAITDVPGFRLPASVAAPSEAGPSPRGLDLRQRSVGDERRPAVAPPSCWVTSPRGWRRGSAFSASRRPRDSRDRRPLP